jgi:dihydroflavonol-4-reductase
MILITGATGLIGAHLLYRLLSVGNQRVRIVVRNRNRLAGIHKVFGYYGADGNELLSNVEIMEGDLLDMATVVSALAGVSKVYHCAAIVSFHPSERERIIRENIALTAMLVDGCLLSGVKKLVHVSSTSATGRAKGGAWITEELEWRYSGAQSGYAVSKFESEREVWRAVAEGLSVVIVNPAMVLGPGNWGESSTALITKCYSGLKFYTEGVNAYVDVRDVAEVMVQLMECEIEGERFILASGNITFRQFFSSVCLALGRPEPSFRAKRWMGELVWRLERIRSLVTGQPPLLTRETARTALAKQYYSSAKIEDALGFTFRPLEETISWTCEHYLADRQG